jgi:hypothetical protein
VASTRNPQTTPHDESEGFLASVEDACGYWEVGPEEIMPQLVSGPSSEPIAQR